MNWPLFFMLSFLTLTSGGFLALVTWAKWDDIKKEWEPETPEETESK